MSFLQKKKWRWSETILLSPFRPVTEWGRASLPGEAVGQRAEVVPKSAPSKLSRMRTIRLPSRSFGRPLFSIFFIPFFLFRAPHAPAKSARFVPGVASREGLYKSIKDARKKLDLNPKSLCLVSINCSGNRPVFIRLLTRGLRQEAAADCVVRLCDTSSTSGFPFAFSSLFSSSISTYCQWPSFTFGRTSNNFLTRPARKR